MSALVCVLSLRENVGMALCAWLKRLDKEVRFFGNAFPVDYARNLAVESFLASPHQKLWFVDDDMVPKEGCEALLDGEEDINVGVCKIWDGTAIGWNHAGHEGDVRFGIARDG